MSCTFDDLDAAVRATAHESTAHPRADSSQLATSESTTARTLVVESLTADLIVTSARTEADRDLALAVAASARCPVVAVPHAAAWSGGLPTLVGVDGDHWSEVTLRSAFALATALGTGVRTVHCTREPLKPGTRSTSTARAVEALVDECAQRYPDVPVDVRVARSHPVSGLARHAGLAALLVIGCTPTTAESTSRRLLDRCSNPVALVGPHVTGSR